MTDPINWDAWRLGLDLIQLIGIVAVGIYTFITQRSKANATTIRQHAEMLADHEKSIVRIDETLSHAPGHDDLEKLHARISDVKTQVGNVKADVSHVKGVVDGMAGNVDLITKSLLEDRQK